MPKHVSKPMTKDKPFFTEAKIVGDMEPRMRVRDKVAKAALEPFLDGKFQVRLAISGGAVYDGDRVIATIGRLADLIVDKAYRGQGIGIGLVVAWRTKFPKEKITHRPLRTAGGDAVYKKAFDIMYPEVKQS